VIVDRTAPNTTFVNPKLPEEYTLEFMALLISMLLIAVVVYLIRLLAAIESIRDDLPTHVANLTAALESCPPQKSTSLRSLSVSRHDHRSAPPTHACIIWQWKQGRWCMAYVPGNAAAGEPPKENGHYEGQCIKSYVLATCT
jgi:hypothetical protein